jgi:aspartate/methionine/tyrosine aminotransferase
MHFDAPYLEWSKTRAAAQFDLAQSNILPCSLSDLPGASDAVDLSGRNDQGYEPLLNAIASRYGVAPRQVTTATGTSGANFLVFAALLGPGDEVLVERPGYDALTAAAGAFAARIVRFDRAFDDGYMLDPDRVEHALTQRTRLIVITSPHNPTGALADGASLRAVGRMAERVGAHVLVDEVYLDAVDASRPPAATMGDNFISTSSLTKSYGLGGLRCGWALSSEETAQRLRRVRDVVDGGGSIVSERLGVLAFSQLERLIDRARGLLAVNGEMVRSALGGQDLLEWVDPAGGTVVFPRIAGVPDATNFVHRLLTERQTAVVPGRLFESPSHFRLGYGGTTETVRRGLDALVAVLTGSTEP